MLFKWLYTWRKSHNQHKKYSENKILLCSNSWKFYRGILLFKWVMHDLTLKTFCHAYRTVLVFLLNPINITKTITYRTFKKILWSSTEIWVYNFRHISRLNNDARFWKLLVCRGVQCIFFEILKNNTFDQVFSHYSVHIKTVLKILLFETGAEK